jgi:hypothetical protein
MKRLIQCDVSVCHAEWSQDDNYNWHLKNFKTAKVDGKKIKPDTFYMLKNGKFVEVGDVE